MMSRLLTLALGTLIAAIAVMFAPQASVLVPEGARAHSTPGVPYHTRPALLAMGRDGNRTCWFELGDPDVRNFAGVEGYVYYRAYGVFYDNSGQLQYRIADLKRRKANAHSMIYGWETEQFGYGWFLSMANNNFVGYFPAGRRVWLWFQLYFPTTGGSQPRDLDHREYLGYVDC